MCFETVSPVVLTGDAYFSNKIVNVDVLLTVHLSIFISLINQLDAQNFYFTISLFHASTCFEHMCSSSGGQNWESYIYDLYLSD